MDHLLVIPVHRPRSHPLTEVFGELAYLRAQGWDIGFLLLDSCADPGANEALTRDPQGVPIWHFKLPEIERFCRRLDPELTPRVGVANFGKVANLSALIAAALGAETLTRRDGDEFLVARDGAPGYWYPTERDLGLLRQHPQLVAAGTTHFGDCDSDIDAIYEAGGPDLMAELGALLGLPLDFADPEVRRALKHPRPQSYEDWTKVDEGAPIYPGTSTLRKLFRHFPVAPIDETPDVDNLYLALAGLCGWPTAAHGRLLEHRHEQQRKASATGYWVRMASAVDYVDWLHQALPELKGLSPSQVGQRLPNLLAARDRQRRKQRLTDYKSFLAKIPAGAEAIAAIDDDEVLERLDRGFADYSRLLSRWPELLERATVGGPSLAR